MQRFIWFSCATGTICVGIQIFGLAPIYSLLVVACYLVVISIGVCNLRSNIFITCQPRHRFPGKIVLTIDDGPDIRFTTSLLQLLRKYNLPATFFLIGQEAEKYPGLVQAIAAGSHTIGAHGYSHAPWSNFYLSSHWDEEFSKTETILGPYLQRKWFRPPFALVSPHLAQVVQQRQYTVIAFHLRALDFGNRRVHNLAGRLSGKLAQGGVVMIHGALPAEISDAQREAILHELERFFQEIACSGCEVLTLENYLKLDEKGRKPCRSSGKLL